MLKIKFSHEYPKSHQQKLATLLRVELKHRMDLSDELVNYDTVYLDGDAVGYYRLPNGLVLVLYFIGDKGIPFTTIRRATGKKQTYYQSKIGQVFEVVLVEDKSDQTSLFESGKGDNNGRGEDAGEAGLRPDVQGDVGGVGQDRETERVDARTGD